MNIVEKKYAQIVPEIGHYKTKLQDYLFLFKNPIFIGEEMYAEFKLENYSKALQIGTALTIPDYLHHPIDLAKYYQFFAIRALASYYEKDEVAAKRDIIFAKNGVEDFPETIYKKFIYKAFNEIFI